jgi:hypothetical protein
MYEDANRGRGLLSELNIVRSITGVEPSSYIRS